MKRFFICSAIIAAMLLAALVYAATEPLRNVATTIESVNK